MGTPSLKTLLLSGIRTSNGARVAHTAGVIEVATVAPTRLGPDVGTSVIVSRAYQDQVAASNLRISSSESKTLPIPKVRCVSRG